MTDVCNIAAFLPQQAAARPDAPAIYFPTQGALKGKAGYSHYTYAQLDAESDAIARGLTAMGIGRGVRTVLMVKPSLEFFALTFGIFKAGAVPVMIDPGMGVANLEVCLGESKPGAFIGIPSAHVARLILRWSRDTIEHLVTVGRKWGWGGVTLEQVKARGAGGAFLADTTADETAAILFTSGSTGVPKGVVYSHANFVRQVDMIRDAYDIQPGEVDLPTFPLFALFDPALGMATVIPDMDARHPAKVDPRNVIAAIRDFGVTNMFGSPALLNTVGRYAEAHDEHVDTLTRVISAGAPVSAEIMGRFLKMLPVGARVNTPYGATECLPVATIASDEVMAETWAMTAGGAGVCVGRPVPPNEVHIIGISDEPIAHWEPSLVLPDGTIGEVVVRGPTATRSYFNRDASTALAKIAPVDEADGLGPWHRMGDCGYFDDDGRLWFCGRKAHRVQTADGTLFTVPIEGVFNTHPGVFRSALVGVPGGGPDGRTQRPVLVVEREPGTTVTAGELLALAAEHMQTAMIETVLFHGGFPVDIRHNAKIGREKLATWAATKVGSGS